MSEISNSPILPITIISLDGGRQQERSPDLGYQGIETDYPDHVVVIPNKKPPNQELTIAQKRQNRKKAKERIVVEHTLAHIKQFQVLSQTYRNRRGKNNSVLQPQNQDCGRTG